MAKTLSLYIKEQQVKEDILDFCEKNHITISELTTVLYRDFLDKGKTIQLTQDGYKID